MKRRDLLKVLGGLAGGLMVQPALGSTLGGLSKSTGSTRFSRLGGGLTLVHSDLHNHSIVSGDAKGDPLEALQQLRASGIDVACLTEHAVSGKDHGHLTCPDHEQGGCRFIEGINDEDWEAMAEVADQAYEPGHFVSFRGFEYSTPSIGHLNVWFGSEFTDPAHHGALATPRALSEMWRVFPQTKPVTEQFQNAPETARLTPFYDWLTSDPDSGPFGGGSDALAGFNHPGYFGSFEDWEFHARAADQMVLIEAFNPIDSDADYFWYGDERGVPNPFNVCLNAGWRVGFTGVSDEHSGVFGQIGKGRGGLWVPEITRGGVRSAMVDRRSFATLEPGLRLDARLRFGVSGDGVPMGSATTARPGPATVAVDIARGDDWVGKPLVIEAIGPGDGDPTLLGAFDVTVPHDLDPPITLEVEPNGPWMFLRVVDPELPSHERARAPFDNGAAFAYASPWFLEPEAST